MRCPADDTNQVVEEALHVHEPFTPLRRPARSCVEPRRTLQKPEPVRRAAHAPFSRARPPRPLRFPIGLRARQHRRRAVVVTGTRIRQPGVVSSSPIYSIGAEEIERQQEPELEKILRLLPVTAPSDGQNVNNGTQGAATIDLRGLGLAAHAGPDERPAHGAVQRRRRSRHVDDSDGADRARRHHHGRRVGRVRLRRDRGRGQRDPEGRLRGRRRQDEHLADGREATARTAGSASRSARTRPTARANIVLSLGYQERDAILLGDRPLGQLGIVTADGAGYSNYLAGLAPTPPPAGCGGPGSVAAGGSTTTVADARRDRRRPGPRPVPQRRHARRELRRLQLQPVQLLPDAARALQRHRAREPRAQRERRSLLDVQLRQDQGPRSRSRRPACSAPASSRRSRTRSSAPRRAQLDHQRCRSRTRGGHGQRSGRAGRRTRRFPVPQLERQQRRRRRRRRRRSANPVPPAHRRARRALRGLQQRDVPGPASACAAPSRTTGTTTCRSSTARRIACCCARGTRTSRTSRTRCRRPTA